VDDYFSQYGLVAIFVCLAVFVPTSMLLLSRLLGLLKIRPSKFNDVKFEAYECGVQPIGKRWGQFNFRYYTFALLFLVFDVETIFLFPWAVKFNQLGLFAFVEMTIFILILLVGYIYAWRKGALQWD
jgi:NADH:ubiquinone oxidoreductase subunit 3 (subunit A)